MAGYDRNFAGDFPGSDGEGFRRFGKGWINVPMFGGMITRISRQLLDFGMKSLVRNLRGTHPGYETRGGSELLHSVSIGSAILSMFQFSKAKTQESHFLVQTASGEIQTAVTAPPNVSATVFGSNLFTGQSSPLPATWAVLDDMLFFSTGSDLPQFWIGDDDKISSFVVYKGSSGTLEPVPDGGSDFTTDIADGDDGTYVDISSFSTGASGHRLMVRTKLPRLSGLDIVLSDANTNVSAVSIEKYNGAWVSAGSVTDTTASGGITMAHNGSIDLASAVSDAVAVYCHGICGYWWNLVFSAQLSSPVGIAGLRYKADPSPLEIVWDSVPQPAVEAQLYTAASDIYYRYDYAVCDLSEMKSSDIYYFAFRDPIDAVYLDTGESPNTAASAAIDKFGRWDGDSWNESTPVDGTDGLKRPGWVTVGRPASPDQPRQFNTNRWRAYWYYLKFSYDLSDDILVSVYGKPFYNVSDFGDKCICCAAWKQRALFVFNDWPQYIYVSAINRPFTLRGNDANMLTPGDGRANAVRAILCFFNEIIVLQEELGTGGGCTTLYQGRDDATFGKRLLHSYIGGWGQNSATVVEGVRISTASEQRIATVAFWLSWNGVIRCDGVNLMDSVSRDISDRFDPSKDTCVRRGYEKSCHLFHDRAKNVLRVQLVCGQTAESPNWFGVYDLDDGSWYEDTQDASYTAMCNAQADGGSVNIVQVAGDSDGNVWQLNTGGSDADKNISCRLDIEIDARGRWMTLQSVLARIGAIAGGTLDISILRDGRDEGQTYTANESMSPKASGEETVTISKTRQTSAGHLTVSISGAALSIHDVAVRATVSEERSS
jgi:hypothetical protein